MRNLVVRATADIVPLAELLEVAKRAAEAGAEVRGSRRKWSTSGHMLYTMALVSLLVSTTTSISTPPSIA